MKTFKLGRGEFESKINPFRFPRRDCVIVVLMMTPAQVDIAVPRGGLGRSLVSSFKLCLQDKNGLV